MTIIIIFFLVAALCGLGFHILFGRSVQQIPINLLASFGGAIVGFTAAVLLGWNFFTVGGVPLLTTLAGALLFLTLVQRIQLEED